MSKTILRLSCPDRVGLLAQLTGFFAQHGGNLVEVQQFTDPLTGWFFARLAADARTLRATLPELHAAFTQLTATWQAEWTLRAEGTRPRLLLLVSRHSHCLADLLWRWRTGELPCDLPLIISNHEDLRPLVEREGLEFLYLPIPAHDKAAAFAQLATLWRQLQPDLIVLARYMQIIPDALCAEFQGKIINIHHSFLPAFIGAHPYLRAYERGVKLIGATCHYTSPELDAGPIIDQEVTRVEHFHTPDDLIRLGRDCERLALARSVRWHLADRILLHGNKTIVFRD